MSEHVNNLESPPSDVSVMLRAHAELRCLSREVIPVLRQVETRDELPEEQLGAAMAYLEVTWLEARRRAGETDAAHCELVIAAGGAPELDGGGGLYSGACRYYDAVRVLREAVARRVEPVLDTDDLERAPVTEAEPSGSL